MNNHFGICFSQAKTPLAESVSLGEINSHTQTRTHSCSLFTTLSHLNWMAALQMRNIWSFLSFPAVSSDQQSTVYSTDLKKFRVISWQMKTANDKTNGRWEKNEKKYDYKYYSFIYKKIFCIIVSLA